MTEKQYNSLSLEQKIKLTNMCIGVGSRKVSAEVVTKPLIYPSWTHPEADTLIVVEKL